jgi:hypothetical protein
MFAALMQGREQQAAAAKLLRRAQAAEEDNAWSSELIGVLGSLSDEQIFPVLRERFSDPGLRDAIVSVLARRPTEADRARFVEGLSSMQPEVVSQAAKALASLSASGSTEELTAVVRALRAQCAVKQQRPAREALVQLLQRWSERKFTIKETENLLASYRPWFDWFSQAHPEAAAALAGLQGNDAASWTQRLASIDWSQADAAAGKRVFERKACSRGPLCLAHRAEQGHLPFVQNDPHRHTLRQSLPGPAGLRIARGLLVAKRTRYNAANRRRRRACPAP